MPLRIVRIEQTPAGPRPRIGDDSACYPEATVRLAREWLGTLLDAHRNAPPTPQLIQFSRPEIGPRATTKQVFRATRATVSFDGVAPTRVGGVTWQCGTAQLLQRERATRLIVWSWEYVIARDVFTGRVICGPELRAEQRALDAVIEITRAMSETNGT